MASPTWNDELYDSEQPHGSARHSSSPPSPPGFPSESSAPSSPESSPRRHSPRATWKGKLPKEGLEAPLLNASAPRGSWDRVRTRLGISSSATFRLTAAAALLVGVLVGAFCSSAVLVLTGHLTPPRVPWWPAPLESPRRTTIQVHGRNVTIYQPSLVTTSPWRSVPAVIVLHGSDDTIQAIENNSGFSALAEASSDGFVAVYPEMATPGGETWGFSAPWEHAFFQALVDKLVADFLIRRHEVFVCGHSNGGTMAIFMQRNMAGIFQAVASVEGGIGHMEEMDNRSLGRPTMLVWNHNDPVLAEFGGEKLYRQTLAEVRRQDHLQRGASFMEPLNAGNGAQILYAEKLSWDALPAQPPTSVISWSSVAPTHHWVNPTNVPGAAFDAASLIWDFFQAVEGYPQSNARGTLQFSATIP